MDDRSRRWRPCIGQQFYSGSRGRLSQHYCSGWICLWFAHWPILLWPRLERAQAAAIGVCVRASNEVAQTAEVFADPAHLVQDSELIGHLFPRFTRCEIEQDLTVGIPLAILKKENGGSRLRLRLWNLGSRRGKRRNTPQGMMGFLLVIPNKNHRITEPV